MEHRRVGSTDLNVSLLGFGCAPVGSRAGNAESVRALNLALDRGITYFDTADMYGVGGSEETLGRVLRGRRDKVVIASKCGYSFSSRLKAVAWIKPLLRPLVTRLKGVKASAGAVMASQRSQCFDPAYIEKCVHDSLRRLGTDRIDLFYLHDPSMEVVRRGDALARLANLKSAGKLRYIGISCEPDVAAQALSQKASVDVLQVNANLLEPGALTTVLPAARAAGVGIIARQPFANGRLFHDPRVRAATQSVGPTADGSAVSGLALRYLRQFPGIASILPSMMRPAHLNSNAAALEAGPLSAAELALVAALGAPAPQG